MTASRLPWPGAALAARRVAAQVAVCVVVVTALGVVVGSLEGGAESPRGAVLLALLRTPTLLVSVLPALVAVGAGLGAAQAAERGERLSLAAAGVAPATSGWGPLLVGLACGVLGLAVHSLLVPVWEAAADHLAPHPELPWVWLDGAAVQTERGFWLSVESGRLGHAVHVDTPPEGVALAREQLRPAHASMAALVAGGPRCTVELLARVLRPVACSLLAWLAWQRWAATARRQAVAGGMLGLAWLIADAIAREWTLASGSAVVFSGGPTAVVACVASAVVYRTWSQKPE